MIAGSSGLMRGGGSVASFLRKPSTPTRALVFVGAMVAYATAGFLFFEKPAKPDLTWVDAFWWSIVTICTVGYGDYFPASDAGRLLVGVPAMLTGVGILSYALSQIAVFFIRTETLRRKGLAMHQLGGHILVCNYPSRARLMRVVDELRARHDFAAAPMVLVDEELVELDDELEDANVLFVRGSPARAETLTRAAVGQAIRAVVLARDPRNPFSDSLNVATCLALRQLRPDMHVVAECVDPENIELLRRAGCHSIVCVSGLAPGILAHELHDPGVVHVLEELTLWGDDDNNIYVVPVTLSGTATVADLHRWGMEHACTFLAVRRGGRVTVNPPATQAVSPGDAAVVVSRARPERIVLAAPASAQAAG